MVASLRNFSEHLLEVGQPNVDLLRPEYFIKCKYTCCEN